MGETPLVPTLRVGTILGRSASRLGIARTLSFSQEQGNPASVWALAVTQSVPASCPRREAVNEWRLGGFRPRKRSRF